MGPRQILCLVLLISSLPIAAQVNRAPEPAPVVSTDAPLPDIAALLTAVEKHEDRDEALLQQYTYHSHAVIEEFDGQESVKKTTTLDAESIPIKGVRVRKLVARDGKPLSADEAAKEAKAFDKQVDEAKKRKAKYAEKRAQAEQEGKSNDGFLPASRVLQLGTFTNERRVQLNGRPTIVLDYAGNKSIKTKNALEKVVEDLVGTVWIDEQDKVLSRVEGHFLADFKLGLGLILDIHKGLSFTVEQQKINGEVWLPKSFDGRGKASVLVVVARVHGHSHADISDYRKYRASATIVGSSGEVDDEGKPVPDTTDTPPTPQPK